MGVNFAIVLVIVLAIGHFSSPTDIGENVRARVTQDPEHCGTFELGSFDEDCHCDKGEQKYNYDMICKKGKETWCCNYYYCREASDLV